MAEKKSEKPKGNKEIPVSEWVVAAIGLVLVAGAIGTTIYRALTEETTPPRLEISVERVVPAVNGFLVEFQVRNTGNQTAAGLVIEGQLKTGVESVETSTTTLTYAPANSVRQGGMYFTKNPNEFQLQLRALGYEKP